LKKCGLLGKNIGYSRSPQIHNQYYAENNVPLNYELFDINEKGLPDFLESLQRKQIVGFNVTIPYKEIIIKYLSKLYHPADRIGAVNTVVVTDNGLAGYNTDYYGFTKSIKKNNIDLEGKRAIIVGGGGAAKCVYCALKDLQCFDIDLTVRNIENVDTDFFKCSSINSLQDQNNYSKYDIIVNCTPLGGANYFNITPISTETIKKGCIVYDLNYSPQKSRLLIEAEKKGAKIINGEDMLIFQAHAAADIWINEINGGVEYDEFK
jgi:shikimate dehydrogenase